MISIKTNEELDCWLKKYHYFEDGYVLKMDVNPFVITIGLINGSFEANTKKEIVSFEITPINVYLCDYRPSFEPSEDHCIEWIEPVDVDRGVGMQIFRPPVLTLKAESFIISENEVIKGVFKPYLSRQDISAKAPMEEIPTPDFWQQEFKKLGYDIVFRCYGGESKPLKQLPLNYGGFFFQLESRVTTTSQGIFIGGCSLKKHEVFMCFQQCDSNLDSLWTALAIILANIPDVTISCGNCKFTGTEWKLNYKKIYNDS